MASSAGLRRPKRSTPVDHKHTWIYDGSGTHLATFDSTTLGSSDVAVTSEAGYDTLCSYNWTARAGPTIYVPGAPAKWTPPSLPHRVEKDAGLYFVDQNGHRVPSNPMATLFAAMAVMRPTFDFADVDVVTNRNSLRKLLDFAGGTVGESFAIDLELVRGRTLMLFRRERQTRLRVRGDRGYGHNFEAAFTTLPEEVADSSAHHRTINYSLGGLNCVVQHEVDACYESEDEENAEESGGVSLADTPSSTETPVDNLTTSLHHLSVSTKPTSNKSASNKSTKAAHRPPPNHPLPIHTIRAGHPTNPSRVAELKTKAGRAPPLSWFLPQLWFGRTDYLALGVHAARDGVFTQVAVIEAAAAGRFAAWERERQPQLRKLVWLLCRLREMMRRAGVGVCRVVCNQRVKPYRLEMLALDGRGEGRRYVPDEVVEMFWRGEREEGRDGEGGGGGGGLATGAAAQEE